MKIICAPDSFKESISAADAARALAAGVRRAAPNAIVDVCPVADGGEGTMDALITAMGGEVFTAIVCGPLGEDVKARYGVLGDFRTGVVELAEASGLALVPREQRNPMHTTTFGTGELIRHAAERGCGTVILCIGGSATIDGGTGIAQALGASFLDRAGEVMTEPMCGGLLLDVGRVEPPSARAVGTRLPRIRIACDVTNPLCGPTGAAAVYGPQKGATAEQVTLLDAGLAHLAKLLGADPQSAGFGAAGGAALLMVHLCNASIERGIELVLDAINFRERCAGAKLVLTGEGRLDSQSLHGKAPIGVATAASELGVPTIAIVGSTADGADDCIAPRGLLAQYVCLGDRYGVERAMRETAALIEEVAAEIISQHSFGPARD